MLRGLALMGLALLVGSLAACSDQQDGSDAIGSTGNAAGSGNSAGSGQSAAGQAGAAGHAGAPGGGGQGGSGIPTDCHTLPQTKPECPAGQKAIPGGGTCHAFWMCGEEHVQTGEYDLIVDSTTPLGPYALGFAPPSLHLSLRDDGGKLTARLSAPFGTTAVDYTITRHPDVPLSDPEGSSGEWYSLDGSLVLQASDPGAQADNARYEALALSLDLAGRPTKAVALGYLYIPGLICMQNSNGDKFGLKMHAEGDTTPPSLQGGTVAPWDARLRLSEPIQAPKAPLVEGAKLASLDLQGQQLIPHFDDLLALSGKTVTFSFGSLQDTVGNSAPAQAALTFADLGSPAPSFDFSSPDGGCKGKQAPTTVLLSKPGATKIKVALCAVAVAFPGIAEVTVRAWSSPGEKTEAGASLAAGEATLVELPLPASTAAVEVLASGCVQTKVQTIEAL